MGQTEKITLESPHSNRWVLTLIQQGLSLRPREQRALCGKMQLMLAGISDIYLAPAVTVGETEGAMDSTSGFFLPLLLPITL